MEEEKKDVSKSLSSAYSGILKLKNQVLTGVNTSLENTKNDFFSFLVFLEQNGYISHEQSQQLENQVNSGEIEEKLKIRAIAEVIEQWEYILVWTPALLFSLWVPLYLFVPLNGLIMMVTRFSIYKILSHGKGLDDENDFVLRGSLPLFGLLNLALILSKYRELSKYLILYYKVKEPFYRLLQEENQSTDEFNKFKAKLDTALLPLEVRIKTALILLKETLFKP